MTDIERINKKYVEEKNRMIELQGCQERMKQDCLRYSTTFEEKYNKLLEHLRTLLHTANCADCEYLLDVVRIANDYERCLDAINGYRKAIVGIAKGGLCSEAQVMEKEDLIKTAQSDFESERETFFAKYKILLDSPEKIMEVIMNCIPVTVGQVQKAISLAKEETENLIRERYGITLSEECSVDESTLPNEMLVARYKLGESPYEILRDMGVSASYYNVMSDLVHNGNVLVETEFERMADEQLDNFIISYVLRYIEVFPLGAVNVHIFDRNANYLYRRLCNCFQTDKSGDVVKKVVQLHSATNELISFQKVVCEDIFKKTSVQSPDLFSVYENDKTDAFNLIVLRNGLVEGGGYATTEILNTLIALSKPGDIGHKCGFRFLIIDDSKSHAKSMSANAQYLVDTIKKSCDVNICYGEEGFIYDGKKTEVLRIPGHTDSFIQVKATNLAEAIAKRDNTYVRLSEVRRASSTEEIGSIIYIPVGKAGNDVVELPFSCKDESGTVAGQCIGYMAIGQSGSGKSSFFHSVVLNGCLTYAPKDLQFWLLDFKFGGASSKYTNSGLPHVRIIAEDNKVDDALCLFQMISEEMDRRNKAFNRCMVDNIVDYNRIAEKNEEMEYFPRIIIAIDEVQEIFREESASVLQKLISSISVRMRSAGMHFIMVAQNLSDGKSYMLKDAFLPSATGRICFRVAPNIPRDSGFEEEFVQRKQEISELKTGEAYVSYGKDTIKKVKMAYASAEEMIGEYFGEIKSNYPEYAELKPLIIGSKKRLTVNSKLQDSEATYCETFKRLQGTNGGCKVVIGEDAYRMKPLTINLTQHENSSVLFLGNDKEIASSLCTSVILSLIRQKARVHIFNGDRTKVLLDEVSVPHPFLYICQMIDESFEKVRDYRLNQLEEVLKKLYSIFLKRQKQVQEAEDEEAEEFAPEVLVINDLFGIESFVGNSVVESEDAGEAPATLATNKYDILAARQTSAMVQKDGQFKETVQNILSTLLKNGHRYNIHLVLAIKGEPSTWRNARIVSEVNNVVLFNPTQYAEQIENSYYLKEMLKNISNDDGKETMAVWVNKRNFSKIRPIVYKLSVSEEKAMIDMLVKEG